MSRCRKCGRTVAVKYNICYDCYNEIRIERVRGSIIPEQITAGRFMKQMGIDLI